MLIHVKYGTRTRSNVTENTPEALQSLLRSIRRCTVAPSFLWWALPTNTQQADTLEKLLVKSAAFLPPLHASHRVRSSLGFPRYGVVEGCGVSFTNASNFQFDCAVFENTLRKLVNILTWVELYGQEAVLSDKLFKRDTFEKVAFLCEPLVAGREPRLLRFPMCTANSVADAVQTTSAPLDETATMTPTETAHGLREQAHRAETERRVQARARNAFPEAAAPEARPAPVQPTRLRRRQEVEVSVPVPATLPDGTPNLAYPPPVPANSVNALSAMEQLRRQVSEAIIGVPPGLLAPQDFAEPLPPLPVTDLGAATSEIMRALMLEESRLEAELYSTAGSEPAAAESVPGVTPSLDGEDE